MVALFELADANVAGPQVVTRAATETAVPASDALDKLFRSLDTWNSFFMPSTELVPLVWFTFGQWPVLNRSSQ
ncbi:MAG TPA: hypothetical protein VEG62_05500 [Acidimicrobiales bacterium]|nr:hypothetical protein [Acidimicrobiales bacterium]HXZ62180.1 hypothetical protein [Acidimicrobiales bacterium]